MKNRTQLYCLCEAPLRRDHSVERRFGGHFAFQFNLAFFNIGWFMDTAIKDIAKVVEVNFSNSSKEEAQESHILRLFGGLGFERNPKKAFIKTETGKLNPILAQRQVSDLLGRSDVKIISRSNIFS